jgi:hypothetical protein
MVHEGHSLYKALLAAQLWNLTAFTYELKCQQKQSPEIRTALVR